MFATSFRTKLIAWYIGLAAIVALAFIAIAAVVLSQVYVAGQRQELESAGRQVRTIVATRDRNAKTLEALQGPLQRRFADLGVIVRVRAFPDPHFVLQKALPDEPVFFRVGGPLAGNGPPPPPPLLGGGVYFSQKNQTMVRTSPFAGFLELRVRPEAIHAKNGEVFLFIDPTKTNVAVSRFLLASACFFVLVLFIAWRIAEVVAAHTLAPLLRTTQALARFAEGDFTPESVDTNDRSELGQLARAYNGAVAQITYAFDELSKAEEEMRQFVADAGHQLRTPLTVIMGHLSGLAARERIGDPSIIARMLAESRRMKSLIDDLIVLAKLEHPQTDNTSLIDVNELAASVAHSFSDLDEQRISVFATDEPAYIAGSESELFGAVAALVDNALKYSRRSPVSISVLANQRSVTIEVEDDGPGLSDADRAHIFDRFYRGDSSAGVVGTGLGLAIVRRAVERAGGTIAIENRAARGLCAQIVLPAVPTDSKTRSLASVS